MNRFLTSNSKRVIGSGRVKLDARDKKGRQFPVELSLEVMEQNGENLFISFLRDISEEVAAEAAVVGGEGGLRGEVGGGVARLGEGVEHGAELGGVGAGARRVGAEDRRGVEERVVDGVAGHARPDRARFAAREAVGVEPGGVDDGHGQLRDVHRPGHVAVAREAADAVPRRAVARPERTPRTASSERTCCATTLCSKSNLVYENAE